MKWSKQLRRGRRVPELYEIKRHLRHHAGMAEIYFIALSKDPGAIMEIYPSYVFFQPHMAGKELTVIAIERGYVHATKCVRDIIDEVYRATGGFRVDRYFGEAEEDEDVGEDADANAAQTFLLTEAER